MSTNMPYSYEFPATKHRFDAWQLRGTCRSQHCHRQGHMLFSHKSSSFSEIQVHKCQSHIHLVLPESCIKKKNVRVISLLNFQNISISRISFNVALSHQARLGDRACCCGGILLCIRRVLVSVHAMIKSVQ